MILLGNVKPYGTGGSWFFKYGDKEVGNYEEKTFLKNDYGSSAKAKAAALKYQKDLKLQKRLKDNSSIGKKAKELGLTYDEYVSLPAKEKQKLTVKKYADKQRAAKEAAGGFEQSFTHKGKTYTLPTRFAKKDIPTLKDFLKSFDEWKEGGANLKSYNTMPSRVKSMAAAKKVGKKTSKFDNKEGNVWRRLRDYAKGLPPTAGRSGTGELYKIFFDQLKIPKSQLDTIKNFDFENIQSGKQKVITKAAQRKDLGNPLVTNVIDVVRKNPDLTEQELFSGVRKLSKKTLSNGEIVTAAVQAHRGATLRLLKEARKEKIGEFQLKNIQKFSSEDLPPALKVIYNLFPNKVGRDFSTTIKDFYKDNPTLRKRALDKLQAYGKIRSEVQKVLREGGVKIGGKGPGKAAFQFDHPISFAALERSGDIAGAIRTNPVVGDVNQIKGQFLDRRLNVLQNAIIRGEDVKENIAKVEKLKNINQTLFGDLAGDFTIDDKGIIKVKDYGAPEILDEQYNIAKALQKNLPLGGQIKRTLASGALTSELEEVLGKSSAQKFITSSQKLVEFAKKDTNKICKIFGRVPLQAGGRGCATQMELALEQDPVGTATKIQNLKPEGGAVNRIKGVATTFLNFAKSPGVKTFGIGAGVGAAIGLVKAFRNDDPTTYLSNEDQQKNMLVDMATQPISLDTERPAILDYQLPALGASLVGSTALAAPSTIKASKSRSLGIERKPPGIAKTGLRVLGRGLGVAASPALLAPFAAGDIASQIAEGDSPADIATNPFNYLYPAFADQTPKLTRGLSPTLRKFARLGLGRAALTGLSRAGIAGLGASLAIQGLGLLDD
jgi:hypothetical protein